VKEGRKLKRKEKGSESDLGRAGDETEEAITE